MARKVVLLFICVLGLMAWGGNSLGVETKSVLFQVGEKLTYHLKWGLIPIGTAVLWVRNQVEFQGKEVLHISAEGHSNAFLSLFYKVDDLVQSYWDQESFSSLAFQKIQNEGRHHINEIYYFDAENKKVDRFNSRREIESFKIPGSVQDAISCLYEFRRVGFFDGKLIQMDLHQDEKNYQLSVENFKKVKIKNKVLGKIKAVRVQSLAQHEGAFMRRGKMWVWFTDDEERLPVRIKAKASIFGDLSAELIKKEVVLDEQTSVVAKEMLEFSGKRVQSR